MIYKFVKLQFENPKKGDWASSCVEALKYLNINISIEEIKCMRKNQFQNIQKSVPMRKH